MYTDLLVCRKYLETSLKVQVLKWMSEILHEVYVRFKQALTSKKLNKLWPPTVETLHMPKDRKMTQPIPCNHFCFHYQSEFRRRFLRDTSNNTQNCQFKDEFLLNNLWTMRVILCLKIKIFCSCSRLFRRWMIKSSSLSHRETLVCDSRT